MIVGLKNNTLYLKLGEVSKIKVLFNTTGNYKIIIYAKEFWLNKTVSVNSSKEANISIIPLTMGIYETYWKIYKNEKLIADFEIPVRVESNERLIVEKAGKKKKEKNQKITGKLLKFVAKNIKAVLAMILGIIGGFCCYKYGYKKKFKNTKGVKKKRTKKNKL